MSRLLALLFAAIALAADSPPRPEYPQPQFEREQWLNLNGTWEFELNDSATAPQRFSRTITVPFCPESKNSGVADPAFHSSLWYRRSFNIPPAWNGKRVLLHFGAVNYRAKVWVNGAMQGGHEGGHVPFVFDITDALKPGTNTLLVHAEFPPTDRYIPRGKQYWEPKSKSIFYTRTTGIWQTVWLEPVAESYVESAKITSDMDGLSLITARIHAPKPDLLLRTTISLGGKIMAISVAPASGPRISTALSVADPRLWYAYSPSLYDVTFELFDGERMVDLVRSYTGFRSITTEHGRVLLNGRPIFLKMVLDQGYWPESNLTPPSDDAIQFDIRTTQEMGFNGARKHQKLEDPRYLYWADKLGLLVSSEMANAYLFDAQAVERFTREWMEAIERDYNHPSIIMWVPINESWGVPNLRDPRQQNYVKELYALTHAFDNTRPVVDNDGWEHTDMTDLFAIHDYAATGAALASKYKDVGKPGAGVPDNGRAVLAPGYRYNGTPVLLSEFGGIAFIPPGHEVPAESWGYSGVEKSAESALERLEGLYNGIANVPGFAGLCYTQLTDVEQEVNGLLTYDRQLKFPAAALKRINGLVGGR